jgi:hypothetical protein
MAAALLAFLKAIASMWVRKSNEQIVKDRRRSWHSPGPALFWFLIAFVCCFGKLSQAPFLPDAGRAYTFRQLLFASAITAGAVAVFVYVAQFVLKRRVDSSRHLDKIVMCDKCHRVKHPDSETICKCGGTFDNLNNWTWVDVPGERDEE